jgi:hypothetical protein
MHDGLLIVAMRLLQEPQIALKAVDALESLNLVLHDGRVCAELEVCAVVEMYIVVWLALDKVYAFVVERRTQILKRLTEQAREQQQTGALVEPLQGVSQCSTSKSPKLTHVFLSVYQAAPPATEAVLLDNRDPAPRGLEASCGRDAAHACAHDNNARSRIGFGVVHCGG